MTLTTTGNRRALYPRQNRIHRLHADGRAGAGDPSGQRVDEEFSPFARFGVVGRHIFACCCRAVFDRLLYGIIGEMK